LLATATLLARPLPAAVKVFVYEKAFTKNGKGLFSLPETKGGR
jgi:hypothetical protein